MSLTLQNVAAQFGFGPVDETGKAGPTALQSALLDRWAQHILDSWAHPRNGHLGAWVAVPHQGQWRMEYYGGHKIHDPGPLANSPSEARKNLAIAMWHHDTTLGRTPPDELFPHIRYE